jgi:hypothetical protein
MELLRDLVHRWLLVVICHGQILLDVFSLVVSLSSLLLGNAFCAIAVPLFRGPGPRVLCEALRWESWSALEEMNAPTPAAVEGWGGSREDEVDHTHAREAAALAI